MMLRYICLGPLTDGNVTLWRVDQLWLVILGVHLLYLKHSDRQIQLGNFETLLVILDDTTAHLMI